MGLGTGVGLIAAGAVLVWALDIDLPDVDDDALGGILLLAGVVALVAAAVMRAQRPGTTPEPGLCLVTVGAALVWAVDVDIPYVYDAALGWILLVGGIATVVGVVAMNRPVTRRRQVVHRS
jgi:hypothetical protein